jgi:hypothetical protein
MKKLSLLSMLLLLTACSKLSMDNYQLLKVGMEYDEVTQVIGAPTQCEETLGTRNCIWGNDAQLIKATFIAQKAVMFSHKGLK